MALNTVSFGLIWVTMFETADNWDAWGVEWEMGKKPYPIHMCPFPLLSHLVYIRWSLPGYLT